MFKVLLHGCLVLYTMTEKRSSKKGQFKLLKVEQFRDPRNGAGTHFLDPKMELGTRFV